MAGLLIDSVLDGPVVLQNLRLDNNAGFGLNVYHSRNVLLQSSEASGNGTAVLISYEGAGVEIRNNDIHDNNLMIVNTPGGNSGRALHVERDSPAIDRGLLIPGLDEPYVGTAPDIGWLESPGT